VITSANPEFQAVVFLSGRASAIGKTGNWLPSFRLVGSRIYKIADELSTHFKQICSASSKRLALIRKWQVVRRDSFGI